MYGLTIFGDSVMKGVVLEEGKYNSSSGARELLEQKYAIDADNCCKFGATIEKGLAFAEKRMERGGLKPYTMIEFGGNDSDYDWAAIAAQPESEHFCKCVPEVFESCYRRLISEVRQAGSVPLVATLPPISAEKYFAWFCREGLDGDAILRWLGDKNAIYRWQERFSRMAEHIAAEEGCKVIDLRGAFLSCPQALNTLLCDDGIHPNRAGQELIYRTIAARLAELEKRG